MQSASSAKGVLVTSCCIDMAAPSCCMYDINGCWQFCNIRQQPAENEHLYDYSCGLLFPYLLVTRSYTAALLKAVGRVITSQIVGLKCFWAAGCRCS